MSKLPLGEGSIQDYGYNQEQLAKMARLGFIFGGIIRINVDGKSASSPSFTFAPDTPMGRINKAAGFEDRDLLETAIDDVRSLSYGDFASKYLSFGPYED